MKRVEASTECRVLIRGRGSIKDPAKVIINAIGDFIGVNIILIQDFSAYFLCFLLPDYSFSLCFQFLFVLSEIFIGFLK